MLVLNFQVEVDAREIPSRTPWTTLPEKTSDSRIPSTQRAGAPRLDLHSTYVPSLAADCPRIANGWATIA